MKSFQLSVLIFLIGFWNRFTKPIQLNPDSVNRFVLNPAEFSENDNSDSTWKLAPFGRKDPPEYASCTRKNGEAIIQAESKILSQV